MINTAYSVKAFEPRLNKMKGKGPYSLFCRYAIPSGYGMGEGKLDLPIDLILDERPYYDRSGAHFGAPRTTHKKELLCGRSTISAGSLSNQITYSMICRSVMYMYSV